LTWLVFAFYLIVFCYLVTRIPFIRKAGIPKKILLTIFVIKVLAGIAYFQFYSLPANKPTSDTWKFYNRSLPQTQLLKTDPVAFFKGFVTSRYETTGGLFDDKQSYWNDIKDEIMVKLMAITNLFTGNNYYANIIWFNFIFFLGLMAFYRLMRIFYPDKYYLLLAVVFLWPSFLFWCSGIHKDGLIFSILGGIFFCFHHWLNGQKRLLNTLLILLGIAGIFLLRNYMALGLLPALATGVVFHTFPQKKWWLLGIMIGAGILVLAYGKHLHPSLNIPAYFAEKQSQFKTLQGGSAIETVPLQPDFSGMMTALPSAMDIGFLRPHLNEKRITSHISSLEILLFWLVFLIGLIKTRTTQQPPVVVATWLFAVMVLIIIGYTVNFSGAVVRYRALVLPFLLAPVIGAWLQQYHINKK